jgi:hypothetical protein
VEELLLVKQTLFFREKSSSDSYPKRGKENWWESEFRMFSIRLHNYIYNLLFEPDFQAKVIFGDVVKLVTRYVDPFKVPRPQADVQGRGTEAQGGQQGQYRPLLEVF